MDENKTLEKIKSILSEQLGIDPEDIHNEDSLRDQLHMSPSDIADFIMNLEKNGFDLSSVAINEMETIDELIDSISFKDPV